MAYTPANLALILQPQAAGPRIWYYTEAATAATIDASGYISDGVTKHNMKDGDLLWFYNSTSKIWSMHTVTVSSTTVDLGDGTVVGTSTNSD